MNVLLRSGGVLFVLAMHGVAQTVSSPLQIDYDIARFYGDETQVYVELYYSIRENNFTFQESHGKFVAGINMQAEVVDGNEIVAQRSWSVPYMIDDTAYITRDKTIVAKEDFLLKPGEYQLKIFSIDVFDTTRTNRYVLPFTVNGFQSQLPTLSDIELCSSIQPATSKEGMFYKNTLEVIPNPSRLYGIGVPVVYYYLEIYNLLQARQSPENFQGVGEQRRQQSDMVVRTVVLDGEAKVVYQEQMQKPRVYDSSVEIGKINTTQMKAGTYLLTLSVLDTAETIYASSSKKFFVYKALPHDTTSGDTQQTLFMPDYLLMNETQLDEEFAQTRYIATDAERNQYKLLSDVNAKRKFLSDFWKRRDPDPTTHENEYRVNYTKKVELAQREFSVGVRPGWESDRGRVLILYGKADEIERFPSTSESNPYEIWHYNSLQGGVIFVFVDRTGFGDYVLVHATHRDELRNERWFQEYAQKMR